MSPLDSRFLRKTAWLWMLCGMAAAATRPAAADTCGYPDTSNPPRSGVVFNESTVLRAFDPVNATTIALGQTLTIKAFYSDEHALTLGVRRVIANGTTTDYPFTASSSTPTCASSPLVGTTIASGDQSGNDTAAGGGRPLWPALFLTDLTVNGSASRIGDWQQGGTGVAPSRVCGVWKGAVKTVSGSTVTVTPDADPPKNNWNLGAGADPVPAGLSNEGYGAEIVWDIAQLGLQAGHTYRLQFMVHDGDQNKTGGDVGEGCTIVTIAPPLRVNVIPETSHLCQGQTVELCAQIDAQNPGLPPYTFAWTKQS